MFGGRVAVHSIGMYVYCACVCHTVHVGCPRILCHFTTGLHSCMCISTACCNSLTLSSYHLPGPLAPLVDSLVACQRLTSLELARVTLSLQSLLAVVKGLHNLRALGLVFVSLSDERVSD